MLHTTSNMPHGLGLLTTVASLPPKYRSRYLNIKTKCEIPLDLSVKPLSPISNNSTNNNNNNNNNDEDNNNNNKVEVLSPQIAQDVPMATNFTEVYTEPTDAESPQTNDKPMTPPITPTLIPTTISMPTIRATIVSIKRKYGEFAAEEKEFQELKKSVEEEREAIDCVDGESVVKGNLAKLAKTLTITKQCKEIQVTGTTTIPTSSSKSSTMNHTDIISKANCDKKQHTIMTPLKPIKQSDTAPRTSKSHAVSSTDTTTSNTITTTTTTTTTTSKSSKNKATRKLKFDEETSSPVSGTIIRPLEDVTGGSEQYSNGDIDPRYNIVEISEESKAELAAIKNVIGDYICKLCRLKFEDAFGLARHRCACIVLLEYRCPECGKQFNCPANLASHRRWHKPKKDGSSSNSAKKENQNTINTLGAKKSQDADLPHACTECGKKFKRQAYLRKHQSTHVTNDNAKGKMTPTPNLISENNRVSATVLAITDATSTYQSYAGSTSSISSMHSYQHDTHEEEPAHAAYDYTDADTMSDCSSRSSSSVGYGRLQIVENTGLTEEENIAAAALTNLRNCASVIKHTTLAH